MIIQCAQPRTPKNAVMPKNKGNLKMLIVGFFESLRSERAIVARCEDSLSVRAFLGYGLRKALHRAARAVKSQSGKALLRKRGMHLERSFEHVLDEVRTAPSHPKGNRKSH